MSCFKNNCCKNNAPQEIDYLVCTCMDVMYSDICKAIDAGVNTFKGLSDALGVGTGCSSCVKEVEQILAVRLQQLNQKAEK